MKKVRKIIFAFLILATVSTPFLAFLNVDAETAEAQRGTLRCPTTLAKGVQCVPHVNAQGVTESVDIIYGGLSKPGDIQIVKTVTRLFGAGQEGYYNVKFSVKGKDVPQMPSMGKVYVAVIVDYSATIEDRLDDVKKAAKTFAETLIPNEDNGRSDFYIKLLTFTLPVKDVTKGYKNFNFKDITLPSYSSMKHDCVNGRSGKCHQSFIDEAFKQVKFPNDDSQKFVFIYGDGRYWYKQDTDVKEAKDEARNLRNAGAKIYAIRYNGSCIDKCGYRTDDTNGMKNFVSSGCDNSNNADAKNKKLCYWDASGSVEQQFKNIAENIHTSAEESASSYVTDLTDNLGIDFYFAEDTGTWKRYNVGKIDEKGYTTGSGFNIYIDKYASKGWHETNNSFNLSYTNTNGEEVNITVDTNPEVYWIPDKKNAPACSGPAIVSGVRKDTGDPWNLYSTSCIEGYNGNPLEADFYVKDIPESTMSDNAKKFINLIDVSGKTTVDDKGHFTIASGLGIPAYVKLKTAVRCSYKFNYDEFKNRYAILTRGVNLKLPEYNASDSKALAEYLDTVKEKLSAYKQIVTKLIPYVTQALNDANDTKNTMVAYGDTFINQPATMTVTYTNKEYTPNKTVPDKVNLTNIPGTISQPTSPTCVGTSGGQVKNQNIAITAPAFSYIDSKGNRQSVSATSKNVTVPSERTCTIAYSKEMALEDSCLNMTTGEQETCVTDSNKQIAGGSKFYTKMQEEYGIITINIPGLGMNGNVDVSLSTDESGEDLSCTFDSSKKLTDIMYRQIDLDDPFLESYDPKREVGENYSSHGQYKYNFENIIKPETWRQTSDYYYSMSKEDIQTIRKDTNEEGKKSYLGRNCYFRDNSNKFVCEFTRDRSMFYDSNIDNDKK